MGKCLTDFYLMYFAIILMNFSKLSFKTLTNWQGQVFSAALTQRMLPNYQYFAEGTGCGNYSLVENLLDIIWQKLSGLPIKINLENQLEKLQSAMPVESEHDCFAIYPAMDVCTGLDALLHSLTELDSQCASEISLLSQDTVAAYLRFSFFQSNENNSENKGLDDNFFDNEPLMCWEHETQAELFDLVKSMSPSKSSCQKVKAFVLESKMSNLAIEY